MLNLPCVHSRAPANPLPSSAKTDVKCDEIAHAEFQYHRADLINKNCMKFDEVYERGDELGSGSSGLVLRCRHRTTGDDCAVKFIRADCLTNTSELETELNALLRLDHPNIMRLVEYFEEEGHYMLVCQLCSGGSLSEFIERALKMPPHRLREDDARHIVRQILKAVRGCHAQDVIHRDVKPDNFVFSSRGPRSPLVMVDLGLSVFGCPEADKRGGDLVSGTVPYMAPEQLRGEGFCVKSDVWSVGCIAFYLLLGEPLVRTASLEEVAAIFQKDGMAGSSFVARRLRERRAPLLLSPDALSLLQRMLETDPGRRISAAEALSHPFVTEGQPIPEKLATDASTRRAAETAIGRIRHFLRMPALAQLGFQKIAHLVPAEADLSEMRDLYRILNTNGDGNLTDSEIRECLTHLQAEVPEDLEDLLRQSASSASCQPRQQGAYVAPASGAAEAVSSDDGASSRPSVTFAKFLAMTLPPDLPQRREYAVAAWGSIDSTNTGYVSAQDLAATFPRNSLETARRVIAEVTGKLDGRVDFVAFEHLLSLRGGATIE